MAERATVWDETWVKARKRHTCDGCREPICVGTVHVALEVHAHGVPAPLEQPADPDVSVAFSWAPCDCAEVYRRDRWGQREVVRCAAEAA